MQANLSTFNQILSNFWFPWLLPNGTVWFPVFLYCHQTCVPLPQKGSFLKQTYQDFKQKIISLVNLPGLEAKNDIPCFSWRFFLWKMNFTYTLYIPVNMTVQKITVQECWAVGQRANGLGRHLPLWSFHRWVPWQLHGDMARFFWMVKYGLPSGKRLHNYGKSPFFMGKLTISMAIFNSYVSHYQRVMMFNDV